MQVSSKNLARFLMRSLEDGVSPDKLSKDFQKYLNQNHLLGLLPKILENLDRELRLHENETSARIKVSHDVGASSVKLIEKLLNKSPEDKTKVVVDESLIGGFRAEYRGRVYDGSIKNYLRELRAALVK